MIFYATTRVPSKDGTTNGTRRYVEVPEHVLRNAVISEDMDPSDLLDDIEMWLMNDQAAYFTFYEDATDDEYDVELEDRRLVFEL